MPRRLSTDLYLFTFLLMVNTFIGSIASYSWGLFNGHLKQLDKAMLRLDSFKQNRSIILEYIKLNCSQLIIEYPEFYMDPKIDLCSRYDLSLKLINFAIILSTSFTGYLLYALFDSFLLSSIIIGISLIFLFTCSTNFSNDGQTVYILELILVFIDFAIMLGDASSVNSNNQLDRRYG